MRARSVPGSFLQIALSILRSLTLDGRDGVRGLVIGIGVSEYEHPKARRLKNRAVQEERPNAVMGGKSLYGGG